MPAVNFFDAFGYKWGQAGTAFNWDDAQYKLGWSTVGSVPPSVEQFNRVHQVADEKANWLFDQLKTAATAKGITLAAADLQGLLKVLNATAPAAAESTAGVAKIATTAQAQAMADNATILTPKKLADAFLGGKRSVTPTGWYQIFPGGFIVQGGSVQGYSGYTITLPTAFPNGPLGHPIASAVGGEVAAMFAAANIETSVVIGSQFKIFTYTPPMTGGGPWGQGPRAVSWLAFGY
jgi:hypothetical protein